MDAFEFPAYNASPGEERLRLWNIEKKPEIERRFKEMQREINAGLGQKIRNIVSRTPYDHNAVITLCKEAEEAEADIKRALNEGVEAEAKRLLEEYTLAALSHPGEPVSVLESVATFADSPFLRRIQDPSHIIRARLKSSPESQATSPYCSPVLMETLLHEGTEHMPNTHRKRLELDFPARVEALLDFHCIAFHADIDVLKELYNEDILDNKEKRKDILDKHRSKMEELMATFAGEMHRSWAEEKERQRMRSAHGPNVLIQGTRGDWADDASFPTNSSAAGVRKRAHMADPPTNNGAAARKPKTAPAPPIRGILKKPTAGASGVRNMDSVPFSRNKEARIETPTFDEGFDSEGEAPGSFFLQDLIVRNDVPQEFQNKYQGDEIVEVTPKRRQWTSASQSQGPSYEVWQPGSHFNDTPDATPRAVSNFANITQQFEERMEKGKGKGKARVGK
ncbi:hypothetical protein FB451DRAFT_1225653 [Mycena latifolia]|nr:hypothetical protein FB451DRAFT_1225653 [Mycena latifolia]